MWTPETALRDKEAAAWVSRVALSMLVGFGLLANFSHAADLAESDWDATYTLQNALEAQVDSNLSINGPTVNLSQAISEALEISGWLAAQKAAEQAADELVQSAGTLPDPTLSLELNNLPVTGATAFEPSAEPITRKSVGLQQKWVNQSRRSVLTETAQAERGLAQVQHQALAVQVAQSTAKSWLNAYFAAMHVQLLSERAEELGLQVQAAQALFQAGTGAQADVFAAQTELGLTELQLHRARTAQSNAQAELSRWVGRPVQVDEQASFELARLSWSPDTLFNLHKYPEIQQWSRETEKAQSRLELAEESLRPDWTYRLQYSQRGNGFSDTLSLSASRPLLINSGNRQDREIAAAKLRLDQVNAQRREAQRALGTRIHHLHQNWQDAQQRASDLTARLLPLAEQRTEAALEAYRGNATSLSNVLAARRMEIDLRLERLNIEREGALWWADLEFGLPSEDTP